MRTLGWFKPDEHLMAQELKCGHPHQDIYTLSTMFIQCMSLLGILIVSAGDRYLTRFMHMELLQGPLLQHKTLITTITDS
jgi:hypothetical protein